MRDCSLNASVRQQAIALKTVAPEVTLSGAHQSDGQLRLSGRGIRSPEKQVEHLCLTDPQTVVEALDPWGAAEISPSPRRCPPTEIGIVDSQITQNVIL